MWYLYPFEVKMLTGGNITQSIGIAYCFNHVEVFQFVSLVNIYSSIMQKKPSSGSALKMALYRERHAMRHENIARPTKLGFVKLCFHHKYSTQRLRNNCDMLHTYLIIRFALSSFFIYASNTVIERVLLSNRTTDLNNCHLSCRSIAPIA